MATRDGAWGSRYGMTSPSNSPGVTRGDAHGASLSWGPGIGGDPPEASQRVTRQTPCNNDTSFEVVVTLPSTMVEIIAHRIATIVIAEVGVDTTANRRAQLLTTREAAALLSVNRRTVSRLVERDELHAYDIAGCPRFRMTEVEEYIESSKREPRMRSTRPSSKRERSPAAASGGLSFAERLRCLERQ